jgi:ATP-dependent DNA helicase RecG
MVRTSNGFEIAEADLEIRGPGEFFGTRQSGSLGFHIANPVRDQEVLVLARREAFALVDSAATYSAASSAPELQRILRALPSHWQQRYNLAKIA